MFYSFLNTALRNLFKTKVSSFINIAGLSIGLSCCLLISLYIIEEFRYDRHFKNVDRLFRVTANYTGGNDNLTKKETPTALAADLQSQFGEIEATTRMLRTDKGFLFSGEEAFMENIILVDSTFINVFQFDIVEGSARNCLTRSHSMIISASLAEKLYGNRWMDRDILGATLSIDGKPEYTYTLSGVFKDFPANSHFHSNVFVTDFSDFSSSTRQVYTYILLKENASAVELSKKVETAFVNREWFIRGKYNAFALQPVGDIHLYSTLDEENDNHGTIGRVYTFGAIAIFLLVICSVNFINLYVANAGARLKEVGVRRAIGSSNRELFIQFLLEPVIITAFAMMVSVVTVSLLLPEFNQLLNKTLSFSSMMSGWIVLAIVVATLAIGLGTGVYPAALLAFKKVVPGAKHVTAGNKGTWFQNGLIVIQFALSAAMIVLTIVAFQQVSMIQNKDLGYERDKVLLLQNPNMLGGLPEMISFKNELLRIKGVEDASISGYTPSQNLWGRVRPTIGGKDALRVEAAPATWLTVDNGFLPTLKMKLLEGTNFSKDEAVEKDRVLINETAVRQFRLEGEGGPLNKEISFLSEETNEVTSYRVAGVVKDFNFGSLHEPIRPVVMTFGFHRYEIILRLASTHSQEAISDITQLWKRFLPRVPLLYAFLSDRYDKAHEADISAGRLFSMFGMLNILVACMGLFGLVSNATQRRTKEIGIRKVLGASGWAIMRITSAKFLRLITVAFILSLPLAWTLAGNWLNNFAYKVPIPGWAFLVTGMLIFVTTWMTIASVTMNAARANPVDSLKHE